MGVTVCQTIATFLCLSSVLIIAVLLGVSIDRVETDEVCQIFYQDGSVIKTESKAGYVMVGPGQEKHCIPLSMLRMTFDQISGDELNRVVSCRTAEGLEVTLEIDIEYQYEASNIDKTIERTGLPGDDTAPRLLRTARSEIRNAASQYSVTQFLTGSRSIIASQIQHSLQRKLKDVDGVFVTIVKVNLLHIDVYEPFEAKYQAVEDARLEAKKVKEDQNLMKIEETRLTETQEIAAYAENGKLLQEAASRTAVAQLQQAKEKTVANTRAQSDFIAADSDRKQRLIRVQSKLAEAKEDRELQLAQIIRQNTEKLTRAETNRSNLISTEQARVLMAHAKAEQAKKEALIKQEKTLASLEALNITHVLEMFQLELAATVKVDAINNDGEASAAEQLRVTRQKTAEFELMQDKLNLTDRGMVSVLMYRALKRSDPTVMLDYEKEPLLNEFGSSATMATVSAASGRD